MPTITDLGQKVKAKYPGQYDDLSDAEVGKKVKAKYPDDYKDFADGGFSKPKGLQGKAGDPAFREEVAKGGGASAYSQRETEKTMKAGASEQSASNLKAGGQFAGTMAKGVPVAAATALTGGLALGPALTLMGGAGLLGSVTGQGIEEATGTHKTASERVGEAGLDTGAAMLGEGVGRGIGFAGKTLLPKLISQAAAKTAKGAKVFEDLYHQTSMKLIEAVRGAVAEGPPIVKAGATVSAKSAGDVLVRPELDVATGTPLIDVSGPLKKAYKAIGDLPFTKGAMSRYGGMADKVTELMGNIEAKLKTAEGQVSSHQPLDELIEMKRSLQTIAYKEKDINRLARPIIKNLAADLDASIRASLKAVGGEASALYKKTNDIVTVQLKAEAAADLAKAVMKRMISSTFTGGVGYYYGGGKGALAGSAIGIATPELSALLLEQIAAHPKAAGMYRSAVNAFMQGGKGAIGLARRAMDESNATETVQQAKELAKAESIKASAQ